MGLTTEQIGVKMRLSGAAKYSGGMDSAATSTAAYGDSAERAGAQAKGASVGIGAMSAASKKGMGALTGLKKAGEGIKSAGSKMTSTFTVPIALIGGIGVKSALDFSDSMEQISTQAGASQREVRSMTRAVMGFAASGESASGPNELAKGLFSIESAGFRGAKALDALKASEHLATVGHADFEKTAKAVAAAMATNIKGSQNLEELVGTLNSTVGVGSMRFEDLLSAMGTGLLDRSASLGLSLKEVGAALGTMTTVGQPAAASATRMAMAFNMMAAPTSKAKGAMKAIGLQSDTLALSLRNKGLIPTLELLKGHLDSTFGTNSKGLSQQANAISEMFGGGRTSGGVVALLRHIELLKTKQGELVGVVGKFQKAEEHTNAEPIVKLQTAWAQLQVTLIQIGNMLIPVLTSIAQGIAKGFHAFSKLSPELKKVIIWFAVGLAVIGPILTLIGGMTLGIVGLITVLTGVSGLVIAAVAAVILFGAAFYIAYHKIKPFRDAVDYIVSLFGGWANAAAYLLTTIWPIGAAALFITAHFEWLSNAVQNTIGFFAGLAHATSTWVTGALSDVQAFFTSLPGTIGTAIAKVPNLLWSALKKTPRLLLKFITFFAVLPIRIPMFFLEMAARAAKITWSLVPRVAGAGVKINLSLLKGLVSTAPKVLAFFIGLDIKIFKFLYVSLPVKLFQVGVKGVTAMVHGLVSASGKIWAWVSTLPGKFASAVASIVPQLLTIGGEIASAIAEGLINELKSVLPGPVVDALEGAGGVAGEVGGAVGGVAGEVFGGLSFDTGAGVLPDLGAVPGGFALPNLPTNRHHKRPKERQVGPIRGHNFSRAVELDRRPKREDRGGKKITHVKIPVTLKVGKRKFGAAMADAFIEDESNE